MITRGDVQRVIDAFMLEETSHGHYHHQLQTTQTTPCHHRHDHHGSLPPLHRPTQCWSRHQDHHFHGDDPDGSSLRGCQTTATASPRALSTVPRFLPSVGGRG